MRVIELEKHVAENSINVNHLLEFSSGLKSEIEKIKSTNKSLSAEINEIESELVGTKKRYTIVSSSIAKYTTRLQSMVDDKIDNELSELSDKKVDVLRKIENNEIEHREIITKLKSLENDIDSAIERKNEISNERESLEREKLERQDQNESASQRLEQLEKELVALREEEQKIIDVSGDSYSILQNYEKQIKSLD
jgi:chromosome segregation protein